MRPEQLGPYRIGLPLGRGGMGTVYSALNRDTGETAAVKVLSAVLGREEGFRDRFASEIESLKKLEHPNIVRLLGYGTEDDYHFYAMELLEGGSLEDMLRAGRSLPWPEAIDLGVQICKALKHAHDRGIIHRDIKPANLLLAGDGIVKLSDFGIAKLFGNTGMTAEGGLLGTAEYMAPEQADGRPVGYRCDLYSLGGVLYAMMAGHPPFRAKTLPEMLQMQRFNAPDPLRRHAPHVPAEIEEIVQTLLEKEPDRRVPTAFVLGRRLEATRHGLAHQQAVEQAENEDHAITAELPPKENQDQARASPNPTVRVVAMPDPSSGLPPTAEATAARADARESPTAHLVAGVAALASADVIPVVTDPPDSLHGPANSERAPTSASNGHGDAIAVGDLAARRKFTMVSRDDRMAEPVVEQPAEWVSPQTWLLAVAMLAVGAVAWWFLQPPSADRMYRRIAAAAQDGRPETLAAVEDDIASFLAIYPNDARNRDVFRYQEQVEQYRLERKFARRARQGGRQPFETAIERAYFEAMAYRDLEPLLCRRKLQAMIDLYDVDEADVQPVIERQCLMLARRQLERLDEQLNRHTANEIQSLASRLAKARQSAPTDPESARRIWRAIVELYGGRPWANDMVDEARRGLTETAAEPQSAHDD